ncbi:hypothetical protein CCR75_004644 [Bremia lactucae]|uniref:Uncharacterized protein n=1 Tax=Bremia lactucae TaxID=4779 RepID=A0A976FQV2_BRELC|nr:hypothetical protein CCR75_004644 [Bremia lactucae]
MTKFIYFLEFDEILGIAMLRAARGIHLNPIAVPTIVYLPRTFSRFSPFIHQFSTSVALASPASTLSATLCHSNPASVIRCSGSLGWEDTTGLKSGAICCRLVALETEAKLNRRASVDC